MSENRISEEHSNPQNRHALGAPLGNPALSTHHPAGAAFSQLAFPSVHHHSLFPMMPPPGLMSGGPFPHQSKNAHGINDMGPPMFSVPLNLGVPGQNSNQGAPASLPYEGFNPDSLLASSKNANSKMFSKLSTPTNNYMVPAISTANRPESPNKKKMINMAVLPATLSAQQQKTKSVPLSLPNSHMLLTTHQSTTTGVTTGSNNTSGTKSAFSVVVPPASSNVKVSTEDGELLVNRNVFLKDASGTTIDVLHSINNSNNQFRTTSELLNANNLHWKQTSSETVATALQNSYNNTSGSKALGTHTTGSHTTSGQVGGVTEASGAAMVRHNKPSNPLTGTSIPPMDSSRVPNSTAWSSVTHSHNDKASNPPPTVVTNVTRALSSNATSMAGATSSLSSVTTTLVKPQPQWPSRDHMTREANAVAPAETDRPRSNSLPLPPTTQQQSITQSPTSNRPSILRKRPVDTMKREAQSYSKTTGGQQGIASPTNGFLDYHGNQSPANENAANYPSNSLRLEEGVPDFMSPRKKPRKQLVNPTEDHYASNIPTSSMDTPNRRDESTPTSLPSVNSEPQLTTQDKSPESVTLSVPLHRSPYSVCSNYKPYTKAAHSHFWRYTDVRVKEDNKQQSMSFLNGKTISKQATGWKLSRVQCHLDDVDKLEQKILETTMKLQQRLENVSSSALPCSKDELKSFRELVQGNIDRSNRAVSETGVVKENMAKVLTHKSKAMDLVQRYQAYRQHNLVKHPKRRKTH